MFDVKQNKNIQKNESTLRRFILFLYYYFTNKISIYVTIFARNNREFLICVDCSFKFNFAISISNVLSTKNTSFMNRVLYLISLSFKFFNFFANKSTMIYSQNLFSRVWTKKKTKKLWSYFIYFQHFFLKNNRQIDQYQMFFRKLIWKWKNKNRLKFNFSIIDRCFWKIENVFFEIFWD